MNEKKEKLKKSDRQQQQELARMYYMQGVALSDIADKTGVSRPTITKWVKDNNWEEKRAANNITRQELVTKILRGINKIIENYNNSDDPNRTLDADKLVKLAAAIERIDKKANVVDCIEVFMVFGKWLQYRSTYDDEVTPELLKKINRLQDLIYM